MDDAVIMDLMRGLLVVSTLLLLPPLITALLVGLAISLVQAITSLQEQTLTFVPKILAIIVVMAVLGGWMIRTLVHYSQELWVGLARYGGM